MIGTAGENAYTILETLQKTRFHYTYKAKNYHTGRLVTIKTTEQRWRNDPKLNLQIRSEAELGLRLQHPYIRATLGVFEEDGTVYVVRDFIEGQTLNSLLALPGTDLSSSDAYKWTMQLLEALAYAHEQHIVHQYLNPDNIIIDANHNLVILGFGSYGEDWQQLETTNNEYHPVLFMAPELFLGESTDERSDIYSAGVLIYLMHCDQLPWYLVRKESPSLLKQQTLQRPVIDPDLIGKHVPRWLFTNLNRCLMLDPELRFQSVFRLICAIKEEQEIPYESCLKRTGWSKQPDPTPVLPKPEEPATPEPEPEATPAPIIEPEIPEELSIAPPEEPEPIVVNEIEPILIPIPVPSPEEPEPVCFQPEPATQTVSALLEPPIEHINLPVEPALQEPIPEEPKKKYFSAPKTPSQPVSQPHKYTVRTPSQESRETKSLYQMGKLFRVFGIISLLILLFAVLKYCVLDRDPGFSAAERDDEVADTEPAIKIANAPIPMILLPADSTVIGNFESDAEDDEFPPHDVWIPAFYISPHETTREQWAMVYANYPYYGDDKYMPITGVSFYEVLEFCNAKSELDGLNPCYEFTTSSVECNFTANGYRLPTEAEWEYAAKATLKDSFTRFSGSNTPDAVGWYNGNSDGESHPVGQKPANQIGLHDMSGNVYEWTWSWYQRYTWKQETLFEGAPTGTDKVIRGGSWYHDANEMRVTNRTFAKPHSNSPYIGFRLVRTKK